ncbi:acyltransferase family protein [Paraburkholderia lacunae]|nr:acyltransferase [Paraburkholderia lacunae]
MKLPAGDPGSSRLTYLDGLRGWAAFVVLLCHLFPFFLLRAHGPAADGFTHLLSGRTFAGYVEYAILSIALVFYRFFTDGDTPVYVFFVLSGYVLSVGYVKTRKRELITDQALRRYIRLTAPIFCACFIAFVFLKLGFMYNQRVAMLSGSDWIGGFYRWTPSFWGFVKFALFDVYFHFDDTRSYLFVLWTMRVELFGSFLIFCSLSLCGGLERRWAAYGIIFVATWFVDQDLIAFLMGLFIAEAYQLEDVRRFLARRGLKILAPIALIGVLVSPVVLFHFVPRNVWPSVESVVASIIVVSVMIFAPLQKMFSMKLSGFLGRISFSLYLTHPLVICSFGSWYFIALYKYLDRPLLVASAAVLVIVLSVLCARTFMVFDSWGVVQARRFSALILRKGGDFRTEAAILGSPAGNAEQSIGVSGLK